MLLFLTILLSSIATLFLTNRISDDVIRSISTFGAWLGLLFSLMIAPWLFKLLLLLALLLPSNRNLNYQILRTSCAYQYTTYRVKTSIDA
jgi:hypothetical protein